MTPAQEKAGLATMRGTFYHKDVRRALQRANVPIIDLETETKALLKQENDAGHIRSEGGDGDDARWVRIA